MFHAEIYPPQRLFGRDRVGLCGAEATPRLLMKLGIQLHLAGLSPSNTVSVLEVFGIIRTRSTIHNRVHKAELRPESGWTTDHVAVDEAVIRLDDERYWLYAEVDPDSNELLHTKLEPTRNNALSHRFFAELREEHHVDEEVASSTVRRPYTRPAADTASISDMNATEIATLSNVSSVR